MKNETLAVHGGYETDPTTKAVAVPIYQTVAYEFDSADHGAALFNLEVEGNRYSRIANPTVRVLERRIALLEGGADSLCVSTGQAALNYAVLNLTAMGTNIVSVPQLYGTTYTLFGHILPGQGIAVRFAESDQPAAIEKLIDEKTRAIYCESVGNPAGNICDIEALAKVAARHGIPLVVDNTVATPILLRPIDYGADIVVHSLTKFLGGHGTTLGGAIVDSGKFPWKQHAARFPQFSEPDASYHGLVYTDHFGAAAYIARCRSVYQRTTGAVLPALSAFLLLQGVETVALRVERHVENGRRVAEFLRQHPRVDWINYAGFADNPYHALAQKYFGGRACSLLTFGIVGGFEAGKRFYDALRLIKRLVNMGDAKSLACHPASTTHRQMSAERAPLGRREAGDDPAVDRHRAHRRHHRRSRSGAGGVAAGPAGANCRRMKVADAGLYRSRRFGGGHQAECAELHHHRSHQQYAGRRAGGDRAAIHRADPHGGAQSGRALEIVRNPAGVAR
jgi:O-acetylhomoserine (thiol)-lyase